MDVAVKGRRCVFNLYSGIRAWIMRVLRVQEVGRGLFSCLGRAYGPILPGATHVCLFLHVPPRTSGVALVRGCAGTNKCPLGVL